MKRYSSSIQTRPPTNATESAYPDLWKGLVCLLNPSKIRQGMRLTDSSPYRNHGTLNNFVSTDWVPSVLGTVLKGDASSKYITIPDKLSLQPPSFTVSVWFNTNGFGSSQTLICKPLNTAPWTAPYTSYLMRINAVDAMEFGTAVNGVWNSVGQGITALTTGVWHLASMTWGTGVKRGYVDGVKVYETTLAGAINYTSTNPVVVGADYGASPALDYFNGYIGETRIYNRALTEDEQYLNYVGNSPLFNKFEYGYGKVWVSLRATGDISTGTWSASPLYTKIDEETPSDTDYIQSSSGPVLDTCVVHLASTGTPTTRFDHDVVYRVRKSGYNLTQLDLTVALYEGNTLIASGIHTDIPTGFTHTGFSLTPAQASGISSYSDLRLKFIANEP